MLLPDQPAQYRFQIQGRLPEAWSDWFGGLMLTVDTDVEGGAVTTLTGAVMDQAALFGVLGRIRDLGLPLLLVQYLGDEDPSRR
jgi:hypothetical protein